MVYTYLKNACTEVYEAGWVMGTSAYDQSLLAGNVILTVGSYAKTKATSTISNTISTIKTYAYNHTPIVGGANTDGESKTAATTEANNSNKAPSTATPTPATPIIERKPSFLKKKLSNITDKLSRKSSSPSKNTPTVDVPVSVSVDTPAAVEAVVAATATAVVAPAALESLISNEASQVEGGEGNDGSVVAADSESVASPTNSTSGKNAKKNRRKKNKNNKKLGSLMARSNSTEKADTTTTTSAAEETQQAVVDAATTATLASASTSTGEGSSSSIADGEEDISTAAVVGADKILAMASGSVSPSASSISSTSLSVNEDNGTVASNTSPVSLDKMGRPKSLRMKFSNMDWR